MTWVGSEKWLPAFWRVRNLCAIYLQGEPWGEILGLMDKLFDAFVKAEAEAYEAGLKEGRSERADLL